MLVDGYLLAWLTIGSVFGLKFLNEHQAISSLTCNPTGNLPPDEFRRVVHYEVPCIRYFNKINLVKEPGKNWHRRVPTTIEIRFGQFEVEELLQRQIVSAVSNQ